MNRNSIRLSVMAALVAVALALPTVALASAQDAAAPVQAAPAWTKPAVTPLCAEDGNTYAWIVTLSGNEPNYDYDWSFSQDFSGAVTVDGVEGANPLTTPRGGSRIYVRWSSDLGSKGKADANGELCTPEVTPSPTPEVTPEPTPTDTPAPTVTPVPSDVPTPTPTAVPSASSTPTPEPEPSSSNGTPTEETNPTPRLTLPPTSTLAASPPSSSNGILAAGFVLAAIAGSSLLLAGRKARQVR